MTPKEKNINKLFFKFAIPGIIGMLLFSMQTMIDGIFLSIGVGPQGLAAVNISMPLIIFLVSISLMICTGGAVLAGIARGNGDMNRCSEITTLSFFLLIIILSILSFILLLNFEKVLLFLGAKGHLYLYVKSYLGVLIPGIIMYSIPIFTEGFARVIGKPKLVLFSAALCFSINIFLNYIFIIKLNKGMAGGAIATCFSNIFGGLALIPAIKFGSIRWTKERFTDIKTIIFNGSSEMLTELSNAIVIFLFNIIIMKKIGYLAVAALTIVFYLNNILNILLYGLSQALQPIVSYNLGAKSINRIENVLILALKTGAIMGVGYYLGIQFFGENLITYFSNGIPELKSLSQEVSSYMTLAYLVSFINVIAIGFHTSIGRPIESAIISLGRSIIFILIAMAILPLFFGNIGLWLSIPVGEVVCLFLSIPLMRKSLKRLQCILKTNKE